MEERSLQQHIVVKKGGISADGSPLPFAAASFNKVLSVDAAYHFRTRRHFVSEAARTLVTGGRLVVADLILHRPYAELGWRERLGLALVSLAVRIPGENLVDEAEYTEMLESLGAAAALFLSARVCPSDCVLGVPRAGFGDVEIRPITEHVVPGFSRFVGRHRRGALGPPLTRPRDWYKLRAVSWLLSKGQRHGVVDFVVARARKDSAPVAHFRRANKAAEG